MPMPMCLHRVLSPLATTSKPHRYERGGINEQSTRRLYIVHLLLLCSGCCVCCSSGCYAPSRLGSRGAACVLFGCVYIAWAR